MARSSSSESPEQWFGTRTVIRLETTCGWCQTKDCANCNHELGYYEKLWICGCECNKDWQPVAVVVERKEKEANAKVTRVNSKVPARSKESDAVATRTEVPEGTEPEESGE